ncbi:MAG: hypothetical protein AAGK05_18930, partial [Pseudomonadota bacterium]
LTTKADVHLLKITTCVEATVQKCRRNVAPQSANDAAFSHCDRAWRCCNSQWNWRIERRCAPELQ